MKEAVRFYDPVHSRVEMIPVTQELKKSVGTAYLAYKEWLQREKEEEEMGKRQKEASQDSLFGIQRMTSKRKGGGRKGEKAKERDLWEGSKKERKVDGE